MTENALLEYLQAMSQARPGGEGIRVEELRIALLGKMGVARIRQMLAEGLANGTICRTKRTFESLRGHMVTETTYALVTQPKVSV